jgi:hypothetical protein
MHTSVLRTDLCSEGNHYYSQSHSAGGPFATLAEQTEHYFQALSSKPVIRFVTIFVTNHLSKVYNEGLNVATIH